MECAAKEALESVEGSAFSSAGVYFVVCMALLVISLTETILIVRLVHKQDLQPHVPDWVKRWVLERATVLLCIRDRSAFCPVRTQSSDIARNLENNDSTGESQSGRTGKGESTQQFNGRLCFSTGERRR